VFKADPWQAAADDLPGIPVDQVWIGGEIRHDRAGPASRPGPGLSH
jgi:hypothetical protein